MMLTVSHAATGPSAMNGAFDWGELGRLVRVRALTALSLHFAELGTINDRVPQPGTSMSKDAETA